MSNKWRYVVWVGNCDDYYTSYKRAKEHYDKCCGDKISSWRNHKTCRRYVDNWDNRVKSITLKRDYNVKC